MFDLVDGNFSLMDYHRTHSQLLIRKEEFIEEKPFNTDIRFDAVMYVDVISYLPGLTIRRGTKAEEQMIKRRINSKTPFSHLMSLFVLKSKGRRFYVVAGRCTIHTNNLGYNVSSLTRFSAV